MLSYYWLRKILIDNVFENEPFDYFICLLGFIITIPADIVFSPFEILGALLYFINTKIKNIKED